MRLGLTGEAIARFVLEQERRGRVAPGELLLEVPAEASLGLGPRRCRVRFHPPDDTPGPRSAKPPTRDERGNLCPVDRGASPRRFATAKLSSANRFDALGASVTS